jgi:hypothetical protein
MNRIWKAVTVAGAAATVTALTASAALAQPAAQTAPAEVAEPTELTDLADLAELAKTTELAAAALGLAAPDAGPAAHPPAGAPLGAAQEAAAPPTYTCDDVMINRYGRVLATDGCVASDRGPTSGPLFGPFLIRGRAPARSLHCLDTRSRPSGSADVPRSVTGYLCRG